MTPTPETGELLLRDAPLYRQGRWDGDCLLIRDGVIAAVGTHSELLRESEHYRHVISSLEVEEARLREREVNL